MTLAARHQVPLPGRPGLDVPGTAGGLLERERELHTLVAALDQVHQRGTFILLEGGPGLGKSRMLVLARAVATERGFRALSARSDELEREFSFEAVRQLLEPTMHAVWPDERASGVREDLLYRTLAKLCRTGPALITMDDAHWADADSLRSVAGLLDRLAGLPIVALMTARPGFSDAAGESLARIVRHPEIVHLCLAPLSAHATAAMVGARLGRSASPELHLACHRATRGNPRFLDALLGELASRRALPAADEASRIVPASVAWAVLATISQLEPTVGRLARAASVLGDGAELCDAAAVAGIPEPIAHTAMRVLVRADILVDEVRVQFAYPITREAIYRDLPLHSRSEEHARAARVLARADTADKAVYHLLATEPLGERWIFEDLRRAGREAGAAGATERAVACLRRALREPLSIPERTGVLRELAEVEEPSDVQAAIECAAEVVVLTASRRPGAGRVEASRFLAALLLAAGRRTEALHTIDRAISGLAAHERDQRLLLEADAAAIVTIDPHVGPGWSRLPEPPRTELTGTSRSERRALAMLSYRKTQTGASAAEAAELAELALAGGRLLADGVESVPLFAAAIVLGAAERSWAAEQLFGEIAACARDAGAALVYAQAMLRQGIERIRRGALYEALPDIRTALDVARGEGRLLAIQDCLAALIRILTERGELAAGEDELRGAINRGELASLQAAERETGCPTSHQLRIERGRLRLAQGRPEEALDDLLDVHHADQCSPLAFEWRPLAALACLQSGERQRALGLARAEFADATAWGTPRRLGIAAGTLGWVEGGERGIERIHEAVVLLAGTGARLDHGRAQVRLGAALRRAGRPTEARAFLRSGLALAMRSGALAEADFAEEELAATGIRRRRTGAPFADHELTPSERRVAQLAANDMSNPQIANTLRISRKTVEMHLRSIYRQLDIESRDQVGPALQR